MRIKEEGWISTAKDGKFLLARKWLGNKRRGILEGMNSQVA
jgi:hypothetical protein